jgi:hypothetical protein
MCQNALRAPSRPRADDVRRFCLTCSQTTGRLVQRLCAVLEKVREERAEKKKKRELEKRARNAIRANAAKEQVRAKHTVMGVDLLAEAQRYWDVLCRSPHTKDGTGAFERQKALRARGVPQIVVTKCRRGFSGVCRRKNGVLTVVVRFSGDNTYDAASVRELLLHELAHAAMPWGTMHKMPFRKCLRDAANELWGVEVGIIPRHRYGLDDLIVEGLREKLSLPPRPRLWLKEEPSWSVPVTGNFTAAPGAREAILSAMQGAAS